MKVMIYNDLNANENMTIAFLILNKEYQNKTVIKNIAKTLKVSTRTMTNILNCLIEKKYIYRYKKYNENKKITQYNYYLTEKAKFKYNKEYDNNLYKKNKSINPYAPGELAYLFNIAVHGEDKAREKYIKNIDYCN